MHQSLFCLQKSSQHIILSQKTFSTSIKDIFVSHDWYLIEYILFGKYINIYQVRFPQSSNMCTWKEIVRNCQSLFGQKRKIRVYLILSISFVNCSPYNIEKREECKLQSKLKEASSLSLREWRTDRCWCVLTEFHLSMSKGLIFWQTWTDTVVEEVFGVWKPVVAESRDGREGLGLKQ